MKPGPAVKREDDKTQVKTPNAQVKQEGKPKVEVKAERHPKEEEVRSYYI